MLAYGANHLRALSLPQRTSSSGLPLHSNTRLLSSDEGGPAPKKARGPRGDPASLKDPTTSSSEKTRQSTASGIIKARDVFLSMNNISSDWRDQNNLRRSTRLLNSANSGKQTHSVKVSV